MRFEDFDGEFSENTALAVETTEGELILHWFNTKLRTFRDTQFNHLEITEPEQLYGVRIEEDLFEFLLENNFPYSFDPIVDRATMDWYVTSISKDLGRVTCIDDLEP